MCLFSYNFIHFDFKIELSGYVFQKNCISVALSSRKSVYSGGSLEIAELLSVENMLV